MDSTAAVSVAGVTQSQLVIRDAYRYLGRNRGIVGAEMAARGVEGFQEPADKAEGAAPSLPLAVQARTAAPGELTSSAELVEAAQEFAQAAKSEATRRAYASDLRDFDAWCRREKRAALPATPETVALYVTQLAQTGRTAATIQRRMAAISQVHQLAAHLPPPTSHWEVRQVVQGIRRRLGTAPAQKEALLTAALRRLVASCDPATRSGARDRALLLIGFGAALRRSELVALDVDDVQETDEGLRVRVRRSKTDPEARGDEVGVVRGQHPEIDPVRALRGWRSLGALSAGPLFRPVTRQDTVRATRLSPQAVALIVRRAAQRAGFPSPEAFAGHSLRSGCATQAAMEGAPERAIMRQGRWRSTATVRRYIRTGGLWQENASAWLGL
jgi:site-specific recombinase XerD